MKNDKKDKIWRGEDSSLHTSEKNSPSFFEFRRIPGNEVGVLIVGINKYADHSLALYQCVRDAQKYRRLLVDSFGIPERNIYTLFNEEATRKNILEKFEIINTEYKTRAYCQSSHGFRVLNSDTGLYEEGIVCYDHQWERDKMILDVDIHKGLENPDLTYLFIDACFSGALKDVDTLQKFLQLGLRIKGISGPKQGIPLGKTPKSTMVPKNFIFALSSAKDQLSYEDSSGGVFTNNLFEVVSPSPQKIISEIDNNMAKRMPYKQNPVFIAEAMDLPFFCKRKKHKENNA